MPREWPEYPVSVDISMPSSGTESEGAIRVMLADGHAMLFDVRIPWADYAMAVLRSRGGAPGVVRIYAPELAGAITERKTLPIFFDGPGSPRDAFRKAAAETLKPYEVDGWSGSVDDLSNFHRRVKGLASTYEVNFTRHILDGHPIEPVPSIPHAVLAAQRALAELETIAPVNSSPTISRAIAILRDGLGR